MDKNKEGVMAETHYAHDDYKCMPDSLRKRECSHKGRTLCNAHKVEDVQIVEGGSDELASCNVCKYNAGDYSYEEIGEV